MKGRVLGIDHLGIAVGDPRERLKVWAEVLGLPLTKVEVVESESVRTWFLDAAGTHVELLEPTIGDDGKPAGAVGKYIAKRGEGIHHICLRVDDIEGVLARCAQSGLDPIPMADGATVRTGAGGARVAFLHPKHTGGVLIELSECETQAEHSPVLGPGAVAIAYLREPRERILGKILQLDGSGLTIHGLDVAAWDDWLAQWNSDESGPLAPSTAFIPMNRVEKIVADEHSAQIPSYRARFLERTGRELTTALER